MVQLSIDPVNVWRCHIVRKRILDIGAKFKNGFFIVRH